MPLGQGKAFKRSHGVPGFMSGKMTKKIHVFDSIQQLFIPQNYKKKYYHHVNMIGQGSVQT